MYKTRTIESKKTLFSLDHHCFLLVPKSPLKFPWRSRTLGPLGDLHGTSPGRRVPAGSTRLEIPDYIKNIPKPLYFIRKIKKQVQ